MKYWYEIFMMLLCFCLCVAGIAACVSGVVILRGDIKVTGGSAYLIGACSIIGGLAGMIYLGYKIFDKSSSKSLDND